MIYASFSCGGKDLSSGHARGGEDSSSYPFSGQRSLIMAMLEPSFYPRRTSEVDHLETHISHLFFVDDLVYKIKKAVRFPFLDYSTLARRKFLCQEELRLNRRLAPSVYLGVLPISHENGSWQLGNDVRPIEYTVVMRRLPERRMLHFLLGHNQATTQMMRALAEVVVPFHAQAATGEKINSAGSSAAIRNLWEENLADMEPFLGRLFDLDTFAALRDFGSCFISKHQDLLARRVIEGRIREVHGDLHCEHICFAPEGIQIFDCLEFSPRLRYCDVASDVAFFVMDMESRGATELAREFLNRYQELADDYGLSWLLPFYKCLRALVRAKVETLRTGGVSALACRYVDYACRVRWEAAQPFLVLISGLTGTGKSTLARELSRRMGVPVINSDATRKALAGSLERGDRLPYGKGIYSDSMTQRTYAKMVEEAEKLILQRKGAILDATFHRRMHREAILSLAAKHGTPLAVIHCHSEARVVQERLTRRAEEGQDLSDGRWEIHLQQKVAFEPFEEGASEVCLSLDTTADLPELCKKVEQFLQQLLLWGDKTD